MPQRFGAAMISYSPEQEMHKWWERALIPFVFCRLSQLYPYKIVNDPRSPIAAANGQYLLIRRDAYQEIGGHAAVAGEVLEDVALARRARAAGVPLHFAADTEIARVRMYATFRAMWEGWTKNLSPADEDGGAGNHSRTAFGNPLDSAGLPGARAVAARSLARWEFCCSPAGTPVTRPRCAGIVCRCPASYTM